MLTSPVGLVEEFRKQVSSLDPELYLWKSVGRLTTTPVNQEENTNNKTYVYLLSEPVLMSDLLFPPQSVPPQKELRKAE